MKILVILVLSVFVSGCSMWEKVKPVEVKTIAERPPMYHPPLPMEMALTDVEFEVLTPSIMEEYIGLVNEGKAQRKPYYALTTQQYENLSMNMAEIKRYIRHILSVVKFYRDYDKPKEVEEK